MEARDTSQPAEVTGTTSTDRSPRGARDHDPRRGVALVMACDAPSLGGALFPLEGLRRLVIGRGSTLSFAASGRDARLEIPDAKASRDHAALDLDAGGLVLTDLGSKNGTFVDESPVATWALQPGQLLRVGHTFFRALPDAAAALERRSRAGAAWPFPTASSELARRLDRLERIAPSQLPILILGETGAGKERVARAVHEASRRPGPFVAVNCGAIPQNLVESQLFGHRKGAFSGALHDEPGFIRTADQGTLFLDEVGDLPLAAQASLLRVLQEGEVTPIGASQPLRVDLRILCATHRPLGDMVERGSFREDLYARLAAFSFDLPPLRARTEDLGILVASVLSTPQAGMPFPRGLRFHTDAGYALCRYTFPRNVRELVHAVQTAAMLADDGLIRLDDLPSTIITPNASLAAPASTKPARPLSPEDQALRDELVRRLEANDGNIAAVGREMGKARQQIQRWKRRFGLG
ncbi:MAG: sigma 54-interacting transcriptional regulator [Polyangiaceae bacterium]